MFMKQPEKLDARERKVLLLLICRLSEVQIGDRMRRSRSWVSQVRGSINRKLGCNDPIQAVVLALIWGQISLCEIVRLYRKLSVPLPR